MVGLDANSRTQGDETQQPPHEQRTLWTQFIQQRLKAWQPIMDPNWIISIYMILGVVFVSMGVVLVITSQSVVETVRDYTDDEVNTTTGVNFFNIEVTEDMMPPVWVYYQLDGFHQNHRRYLKSRDDAQLRDSSAPKSRERDISCNQWATTQGRVNYPCGLVARSVFNDSYSLFHRGPGEQGRLHRLPVDRSAKTIAWPSDVDGKFQNIDPEAKVSDGVQNQVLLNMWILERFPPVQCQQTTIAEGEQFEPIHVGKKEDLAANTSLLDCRGYKSNSPSCNFVRRGAPFNCTGNFHKVKQDWGIQSGHFIAWMRVAALPSFRKLWGRIDSKLVAGTTLRVYVENNFPVKPYHGRKSLVLSTCSIIGGRNDFLGYGYIIVGGFCLAFGSAFLFKQLWRPRRAGDISLLAVARPF